MTMAPSPPIRRVLVTGAAGHIGSHFSEHAASRYALRLMVQPADPAAAAIAGFGEVVEGDLGDLDGLKRLCRDVDTVVHLAAVPDPSAVWHDLLRDNIIGCYNTFVAAKAAGCRRVIFASSIHAVSGYPRDVQVKSGEPVNPGDLYGVTKCFGEAMGRYMAEQEGLSVICLRIGAFQPRAAAATERSVGLLDAFVSRRDLHQLICRCIDAGDLRFAMLHALSDNRFKRLDISDARALVGYAPEDDLTEVNPALHPLRLSERAPEHSQRDPGQASGLRDDL
jgi:hypothetical protein